MKIVAEKLLKHVEKASILGLINEIVLSENLSFSVTDDAKSVLSMNAKGIEGADLGKIGLFDLQMVQKTIQYASSAIFGQEELTVFVKDNRLIFKKDDNEFKFLLSNPKVISSTIENIDETMTKLRSKEGISIVLAKKDADNILSAIALINPETVSIYVKEGKILCLIGKETEHNAIVCLGTSDKEVSLKLKPDLLSKVLQVLSFDTEVKMEMRSSFPVIFVNGDYTFVISPITEV